ncbi:MAG TPA: hypothetical protein VH062_20330, partial [Polyangiaceae bacterium]|nr:hypothetical protein [Polyangiaceae bacterium]
TTPNSVATSHAVAPPLAKRAREAAGERVAKRARGGKTPFTTHLTTPNSVATSHAVAPPLAKRAREAAGERVAKRARGG